MNNLYCFKCKKIVRSENDVCPDCKEKGKIVGRVVITKVTNGEFKPH
jgi:RNA polymerase subunit RPABC4/transcription elongation factor Spt4